jgi:hypothetical protein
LMTYFCLKRNVFSAIDRSTYSKNNIDHPNTIPASTIARNDCNSSLTL